MKAKHLIIAVLMTAASLTSVFAQKEFQNAVWSWEGKKNNHTAGLFAGVSAGYTQIQSKPAGFLGAKAGVVFNGKWGLGLAGNALWFDYRLNEIVSDGTYHLESGYAGLYGEYLLRVGSRFSIGFSLLAGQGKALYKYDRSYAESLPWYQEIIDQEKFSVTEPGIELLFRTGKRSWLGLNGSYRLTSALKLTGAKPCMLNGFNTGLSFRYGIF